MDSAQTGLFRLSHLQITALLSVLFLFGVIAWKLDEVPENTTPVFSQINDQVDNTDYVQALASNTDLNAPAARSSTPLGDAVMENIVATYANASRGGISKEDGVLAVQNAVTKITPTIDFQSYSAGDIKTDPDTSKDRVAAYRADLRVAFEPLLNNQEFELDIFAHYIDSGDAKYLSDLHAAANNYRLAIANTEKLTVPADAATYHAAVLNSLGQFAATLDAMANNARDPIASATLLKTYMGAQSNVLASFNAIGAYAAHKML